MRHRQDKTAYSHIGKLWQNKKQDTKLASHFL